MKTHLLPLLLRIWPLPDDLPHAAGSGDLARVRCWFDADGKPALGDLANHFPINNAHYCSDFVVWFGERPNAQRVLDTALAWAVLNNHFEIADFRHVGKCARLERLTCMYCRDIGDKSTEHIRGLSINYYYAGLTQITDRSLGILGGMESLEQVDLYECKKITDAGLPFLAQLPRLREVHLNGLPDVTLEGTKVFGPGVLVYYST